MDPIHNSIKVYAGNSVFRVQLTEAICLIRLGISSSSFALYNPANNLSYLHLLKTSLEVIRKQLKIFNIQDRIAENKELSLIHI